MDEKTKKLIEKTMGELLDHPSKLVRLQAEAILKDLQEWEKHQEGSKRWPEQ